MIHLIYNHLAKQIKHLTIRPFRLKRVCLSKLSNVEDTVETLCAQTNSNDTAQSDTVVLRLFLCLIVDFLSVFLKRKLFNAIVFTKFLFRLSLICSVFGFCESYF